MNRPIGIFDSGIGGLTVVKEVMRHLPGEDVVYFGDTARVPYGTKSPNTVVKFSVENTLFLMRFNVKLIVVACNTSSSYSLSILKTNFKVPVIGVITPGAEAAVRVTRSGRIGVIGTRATINSSAYETAIKNLNPGLKVFSCACPLFVPLVEEGYLNHKITREIARMYLKPLKDKKIDTLILGCTHYPLLKDVIRDVVGKDVTLIDSARQIASYAKEVLSWENVMTKGKKKAKYRFYVSDEPEKFKSAGEKFLGQKIKFVKKVTDYV